jgi:hypothetical protein
MARVMRPTQSRWSVNWTGLARSPWASASIRTTVVTYGSVMSLPLYHVSSTGNDVSAKLQNRMVHICSACETAAM